MTNRVANEDLRTRGTLPRTGGQGLDRHDYEKREDSGFWIPAFQKLMGRGFLADLPAPVLYFHGMFYVSMEEDTREFKEED